MKHVSYQKLGALLLSVSIIAFAGMAYALDWTYQYDPYGDASGGNDYEVYRMGYAVENGNLYFNMLTGYPQTGTEGGNEAGDLYINVGGSHNAGTGTVYGLGLTDHTGEMNNDMAHYDWVNSAGADDGYDWSAVEMGNLYQDAVFSTGVYEEYNGANDWYEDGGRDPFGGQNNIPVHIAEFGADLGYQGEVTWEDRGSIAINEAGTTYRDTYEVNAVIRLADLGVTGGENFEFWWSMECGNELAMISGVVPEYQTIPDPGPGAVPEPGTVLLLGSGLIGLIGFSRKRHS